MTKSLAWWKGHEIAHGSATLELTLRPADAGFEIQAFKRRRPLAFQFGSKRPTTVLCRWAYKITMNAFGRGEVGFQRLVETQIFVALAGHHRLSNGLGR